MSWTARRYIPGKPVIRAIRHRKKILSKLESEALAHLPATEREIDTALMFASDHKLDRWMAIISLVSNYERLAREHSACDAYEQEIKAECASWQFKYLMERQKVLALQQKIGSRSQFQ